MKVKSESEVTQSCPTLRDPMDCSLLLHPWDFPGKSTGVGCHCLLELNSSPTEKPHCDAYMEVDLMKAEKVARVLVDELLL